MKKKRLRSGLVGAGFAATFHIEALRRVYGVEVEVAGVYSRTAKQREAFARREGIEAFDTLEGLLEAVDVVHVLTPPVAHEAVTVAALERDKFAIVEKPLTGYFGDGSEGFEGLTCSKQEALEAAVASIKRMLAAEARSKGCILYAENWVYAPAIQKEREIIEKTGAQVLWMYGEEGHSGSHSVAYGSWRFSGGGSLMGKSCHPLSGALYLKRVEGLARQGKVLRPATVSARTHTLTRLAGYRDEGHLRSDYEDIEDFGLMHVTFEDGTLADIVGSEIIMGGVRNYLEVAANNHRTICNINPNNAMQAYNPLEENFGDIYVVEKTGTKQGWSTPSPDEAWFHGYQQEMEAFYRGIAEGQRPESDSGLAADTIATIYSAYLSAERKGAEVAIEQL